MRLVTCDISSCVSSEVLLIDATTLWHTQAHLWRYEQTRAGRASKYGSATEQQTEQICAKNYSLGTCGVMRHTAVSSARQGESRLSVTSAASKDPSSSEHDNVRCPRGRVRLHH